ncbi:MAG: cob(I)yrinic acid a,c-diamide adenosyltransferase [Persephonella sp.]|nr:cob(I)yrinic acid a,c-diamide adenosyltransferase [Persephonella sp.]
MRYDLCVYRKRKRQKTTAAVGTGVRAVGAGKNVLMIQFMKVKELSSEYVVLSSIKGFDVVSFGREDSYLPEEKLQKKPELIKMGFKPFSETDYRLAEEGIEYLKNAVKSEKYQIVILDEICVALHYRLISEEKIKSIILNNRESKYQILYLQEDTVPSGL